MLITLRPNKMIHGGNALARLKDGRIALVKGALPGELIEAELAEKKGVLQGRVKRVLEPSPDRIEAPQHPGLDYGFIAYPKQLELKSGVILDALARARVSFENVKPATVTPSPEVWQYRNTVQPSVQKGSLGYRKTESHEVVYLENDPTAQRAINQLWQRWADLGVPKGIRELVFRCNDDGKLLLCFVATASPKNLLPFAHSLLKENVVGVSHAPYDPRGRFRGGVEKLAGTRQILQRYGMFDISISASSFAQPNPKAASLLYKRLASLVSGGNEAFDLYAGSGIIAMHLLGAYKQVTALEIDKASIHRGQRDAERLGLENFRFIRADAKQLDLPDKLDLITVDPPRSGLSKEVRRRISASGAAELIYVSCDIATWARDIADFLAQGWRLELYEPYDFYPHTHHIELLSLLRR